MRIRSVWIMLVVVVAGSMVGCTKLTFDNWQTLTLQSPKVEVETVLGTPNQYKQADRWQYHDPDRQVTVNVEFIDGNKVTYSRWVDSEYGVHELGTPAIKNTNLIERETSKTDIDINR